MQIDKKLDLGMCNCGGGIGIFARNIFKNGDYATVVFLDGVHHFVDGDVLKLTPNDGFNNPQAINQVKELIRSINPRVSFTDESDVSQKEFADDDKYTPQDVSNALKAFDRSYSSLTQEENDAFYWAIRKGYVLKFSVTQAQFTEKAVAWFNSSK